MTIYINHFATTSIVKQTKLKLSNIDKFNLRFVRASIYFSQFELNVKHKPGKLHVVPDVFSKTMNVFPDLNNIFDEYHVCTSFKNASKMQYYTIDIIEMLTDFKRRFKKITNHNGNVYFK